MNEQVITGTIRTSKLSSTVYGGFAPYSDVTLIQKTITANGVYLPSSDNADGYSAVTVNVQSSDNNNFVIKESNNILKYNKVYLGDVWAVYAQDSTTQQQIEHIQNNDFIYGSGTIWKMNAGAIQPIATNWFRSMCFNVPFTITSETTFKLQYSYSNAAVYRNAQFSFWENANPSTLLATSFGSGTLVNDIGYVQYIDTTKPTAQPTTVFTQDITPLQGKTVWLHLFTSDVIPLITGIWFE